MEHHADRQPGARPPTIRPYHRVGRLSTIAYFAFIELNLGHEQSVKLESVLKKCDASRDWTPAEAAALLDEIAGITSRADWAQRTNTERRIHRGKPLPKDLTNAPWGQPAANGLRTAWLLEPRADTHALDSVMKSRVLYHNAGQHPVYFATEDWIQSGTHKAKDAAGKDINVWAVSRMGLRTRMIFRLAPGEYAEVVGHGIGVGSHETSSEKSIHDVGCWIEAKAGDAVTFTPGNMSVSFQTWQNNEGRKDSITVWQELIAVRVMQESPMPAAAADRELLLRRVMHDFPGTAPTAEETTAFTTDNARDGLERLIKSLQSRVKSMHFTGELPGGETKFRVLPADPDAAKKPRTANNPGRYMLGDHVRLIVSRRAIGERIVNEAHIQFFSPDPKAEPPGKPVTLNLPDGYDTWAAAWMRGETILWVKDKTGIRSYDFAIPAQVQERNLGQPTGLTNVPPAILDALYAKPAK